MTPVPRFRSTQPPERQAGTVVAQLVDSGALRLNPDRPPSVRTVANYRDCLLQIARRISPQGIELRDLDPATALQYVRTRVDDYVFALNWAQTYAKIDRELMMVRVLDAVRARDGDLGIVPGSMRAWSISSTRSSRSFVSKDNVLRVLALDGTIL